jgi:hypothetical protein
VSSCACLSVAYILQSMLIECFPQADKISISDTTVISPIDLGRDMMNFCAITLFFYKYLAFIH